MDRGKSIQDALGAKFIVIVLVPFYIVIILSFLYMGNYMWQELRNDHQDFIAYGEAVFSYELEMASKELIDDYKMINAEHLDEKQIRAYLTYRLENSMYFRDIIIVDAEGIVTNSAAKQAVIEGFDYSKNDSFLQAERLKTYWSSVIVSEEGDEITFYISYKGDDGRVIIAEIAPSKLQDIVCDLSTDSNQEVAIVTGNGTYIANSDYLKVLYHFRENQLKAYTEKKHSSSVVSLEDQLMIVSVSKLGDQNIYMIIYTHFFKHYWTLICFILISTVLVSVLSHFSFKCIRRHTSKVIDSLNLINEDLRAQNSKVRKNESQIETIIDSVYDGVLVIDLKGNILRANRAVYDLFEVEFDAVDRKKKCCDVFKHMPENCHSDISREVEQVGENLHRQIDFRDKIIEEETTLLLEDNQMIGLIKTYRDITVKKELEKKLNRATKLEAIGQLTSGIAHDFNNILQVIVGYSELIHYQLEKSEDAKDLLFKVDSINDAAMKAERLIRKLMTFSKMDQVVKEAIELNACVGDISQMLRRIIGENIELDIDLEDGMAKILGDRTQIEQIIVNLCINSKDAIEGCGKIKIKSYETLRRSGQFICLEVSDTGRGMTEAVRDKIFEPFFTTKPLYQGTGLGLATVLSIVEGHGGIVEVESELLLGSTFRVIFPNEHVRALTINSSRAEMKKLDFEGINVLLMDGDTTLLEIYKNMLELVGIKVFTAMDGFEVVEKYVELNQIIDLIVLDSVIPEIDEEKVLRHIRNMKVSTKILITTSYDEDQYIRQERQSEIQLNYLKKPYTGDELIKAIARIVYS